MSNINLITLVRKNLCLKQFDKILDLLEQVKAQNK